jgi:hypothetical protein
MIDALAPNGTAASALASSASAMATVLAPAAAEVPQWVLDLHQFRQRLFLRVVEPLIVLLLGPADPAHEDPSRMAIDSSHRRLGFLPSYVEDVNYLRASSMSFAVRKTEALPNCINSSSCACHVNQCQC